MLKLKLSLFFLILSVPIYILAKENLLRIGGLDITAYNYGSIRIGPHQNQDTSATRFTNYYFDLSTWVSASSNNLTFVSDGDVTTSKTRPDWTPFQKIKTDSCYLNDTVTIYKTVYRDDIAFERHQPLGIEIAQELYYLKNHDWTIIHLIVKNLNINNLKNLSIGLKLDADVPDSDNIPTHNDDMVGYSDEFLYLYDYKLTKEKSNIIGLLPLGENIDFTFNWWDVDNEPSNDQIRLQLMETNKKDLPDKVNDYRI
ncbi:MAG: hypothetical protein SCK70_00315, partial [bacterium]|nr:hypothetical protein [bacterium]